jgi:uncharacterized protein (TIGR03118 family)
MNYRVGRTLLGTTTLLALAMQATAAGNYSQQNLVAAQPLIATTTDPGLDNPWGLAAAPTSPAWVGNNGSNLATLYNAAANRLPLIVSIPNAGVTGVVFNPANGFLLSNNQRALFLFATKSGTIEGWNGGTAASTAVSNPTSVYTGLAFASTVSGPLLYTADFKNGSIDVFDSSFSAVNLLGSFIDPNLPAGYAPYNIENLGGSLYVSYGPQDASKTDVVRGAGNGYVDKYNLDGTLASRVVTQGNLNDPWGMAIAPSNFGDYSNDLLVGNFGDGKINAYDLSGNFVGTVNDATNKAITIEDLHALVFGNGGIMGPTSSLFFTAGAPELGDIAGPHGLYGRLDAVPEPASVLSIVGGIGLLARKRRKGL